MYTATTEGEEALTTSAETIILLAGTTNHKVVITEIGFAFDGTSSTAEPIQWKIRRGNSASQGTSSAATEEKADPDDPAAAATAFHSLTAEPTYTGQPIDAGECHPQGGWQWIKTFIVLDDATNSFVGVEVTAPAAVNVQGGIHWHEHANQLISAAR